MGPESRTAFFSYSREDGDFAKKLAADLKSAGAHVWMDQLDIKPGTRWDDAISQALENSPRVLVILSPASAKSENVSDEVSFALSKTKQIIPVLFRDCDVPFRIARLQHVDFRSDYNSGLQLLLQTLSLQSPIPQAVAPEPPRPAVEVAAPASPKPTPVGTEPAASSGGMNKALLIGIPVLLVAIIVGYFALKQSGLDVTILSPSGFRAPRFSIDDKTYPIEGQAVHLKLAPGDHKYMFPANNCGGTFTVSQDKTTFLPRASAANGECALQPVSN
jgi:hypothetical protein